MRKNVFSHGCLPVFSLHYSRTPPRGLDSIYPVFPSFEHSTGDVRKLQTSPVDCQSVARHGMECEMRRFSTLQIKELLVSGADVRRLDGIRHLAENAQQRLRA